MYMYQSLTYEKVEFRLDVLLSHIIPRPLENFASFSYVKTKTRIYSEHDKYYMINFIPRP